MIQFIIMKMTIPATPCNPSIPCVKRSSKLFHLKLRQLSQLQGLPASCPEVNKPCAPWCSPFCGCRTHCASSASALSTPRVMDEVLELSMFQPMGCQNIPQYAIIHFGCHGFTGSYMAIIWQNNALCIHLQDILAWFYGNWEGLSSMRFHRLSCRSASSLPILGVACEAAMGMQVSSWGDPPNRWIPNFGSPNTGKQVGGLPSLFWFLTSICILYPGFGRFDRDFGWFSPRDCDYRPSSSHRPCSRVKLVAIFLLQELGQFLGVMFTLLGAQRPDVWRKTSRRPLTLRPPGWAAVALCRLNKTAEAAKLAAGPDGQTPCGYQTLRRSEVGRADGKFKFSEPRKSNDFTTRCYWSQFSSNPCNCVDDETTMLGTN